MQSRSRVVRITKERSGKHEKDKLHRHAGTPGRLSFMGVFTTLLIDIIPVVGIIVTSVVLLHSAFCAALGPSAVPSALHVAVQVLKLRLPPWALGVMFIESVFYFAMRFKLAYLQSIDPLEACMRVSSIMTRAERRALWQGVMQAESEDTAAYFEGWFFGKKIDQISLHELRDFLAFMFFECRNLEHLTDGEHEQMDEFLRDSLERIGKKQGMDGAKSGKLLRDSHDRLTLQQSDFLRDPSGWEKLEVQRRLLQQMVPQAHNVPVDKLAKVMRTITKIHQEIFLDTRESTLASSASAEDARSFGVPMADPILGVRILPLFFQLSFFLLIEVALRFSLWRAGFERHRVVDTNYYYHPGKNYISDNPNERKLPIVFMHGLGIGHIFYLPLIYEMLKSGRPIFLPEIASVSACRPWIFPDSVQDPHHVAASLSTMLASHGFAKATFSGHSFGTFWVAYMAKYAPGFVAATLFLDPVCFSLHHSYLSQRMVYNDADPGNVAFIVITDMMVNWSIQRIGWARANLFVQDMRNKPCAIFLSEKDKVAPSAVQETYLKKQVGVKVTDFDKVTMEDVEKADISVVVFRGLDHGDWTLKPKTTNPKLVESMDVLCTKVEKADRINKENRLRSDRYSARASILVPGMLSPTTFPTNRYY